MLQVRRDRSFRYAGVVHTAPDNAEVFHVSPSPTLPMDRRIDQPPGRLASRLRRPACPVVAGHPPGPTLWFEQRQLLLGATAGPVRQYLAATLARVVSRGLGQGRCQARGQAPRPRRHRLLCAAAALGAVVLVVPPTGVG